ncbi:MAG: hypothetical protein KF810_02920 [Rhizobiaceae bacterium]|nr:hypothetical protein [Rhizobiaceae bacterium]
MTDQPYQGRKAGSFIKDKDTGKLRRADEQPAALPETTQTAKPAQPAKKGKQ